MEMVVVAEDIDWQYSTGREAPHRLCLVVEQVCIKGTF